VTLRAAVNRAQRRVLEKDEQARILELLANLGAAAYVSGVRRRAGDYQGTMQTPGIPDLAVFLPPSPIYRDTPAADTWTLVYVEVKRQGGTLSEAQQTFRAYCRSARVAHIVGGLDAVIAYLEAGGWLARRPARASLSLTRGST
jgi:hypothetical protein